MDNMLASMKSGLDGLADATGIDDRHWRLSIGVGEPVKGGQVLVRMSCR
jgi:crossover junction endodeoxyribonuclease RusA